MQCATPVFFGNVVGAQSWVSVTTPCRLMNATGIVTALAPSRFGSSVIRPKYCPFATSGALIVIQMSVVPFFFRWIVAVGLRRRCRARSLVGDDDLRAGAAPGSRRRARWSLPLTFVAVRFGRDLARHRRRVDARDVEVDPVQRVGGRGDEVGERLVEDERRVDRPVGADRARAVVERVGRRDAVVLDDVRGGRGHQRRLDHRRRPVGMRRLDERRDAGRVRARHRGAGDRLVEVARRAVHRRVAVRCPASCPARTCRPGAVTSGLMKSACGPRDEKSVITSGVVGVGDALRPRRPHVRVPVDEARAARSAGRRRGSPAASGCRVIDVDWSIGL